MSIFKFFSKPNFDDMQDQGGGEPPENPATPTETPASPTPEAPASPETEGADHLIGLLNDDRAAVRRFTEQLEALEGQELDSELFKIMDQKIQEVFNTLVIEKDGQFVITDPETFKGGFKDISDLYAKVNGKGEFYYVQGRRKEFLEKMSKGEPVGDYADVLENHPLTGELS